MTHSIYPSQDLEAPAAQGALTRDNLLLSRPNKSTTTECCTSVHLWSLSDLPPEVARYVEGSLAANTRRAYQADIDHFQRWGAAIPSTDVQVATYLASHATTYSIATLTRRLASISKAHDGRGLENPTRSELVKATLRGIRRAEKRAQKRAAPLLADHLTRIVRRMGDTRHDVRDKALLLLGFEGGFRRSELVGLDVSDVRPTEGGAAVHLRQSKTDQEHKGRVVKIKSRPSETCPVLALNAWLRVTAIKRGPIFRPIDRHGNVRDCRLSGEALSLIVKRRSAQAGIGMEGFSGHSLRAGFATSSARAGVPLWKIRQQTGHRSNDGVERYIREFPS